LLIMLILLNAPNLDVVITLIGPSQADKDAEAFHERLMEKYQRQKDCLRMEIEMKKNHYTDHQIAES